MNNLVREHFGPRGAPKRSFKTIDKAREFQAKQGIHGKHAYKCGVCAQFHLGESSLKTKKRR